MLEVNGVDALRRKFQDFRRRQEEKIVQARKEVTAFLLESLMDNIPVWSGRTIESVRIGTSQEFAPLLEAADPGSYGQTRKMSLGSEPMRSGAEATARSQLGGAGAPITKPVFLCIHSEPWGLIEKAEAPDGPGSARNTAIVSAIAIAKTKAKFGFLK